MEHRKSKLIMRKSYLLRGYGFSLKSRGSRAYGRNSVNCLLNSQKLQDMKVLKIFSFKNAWMGLIMLNMKYQDVNDSQICTYSSFTQL